MGKTKTVGL